VLTFSHYCLALIGNKQLEIATMLKEKSEALLSNLAPLTDLWARQNEALTIIEQGLRDTVIEALIEVSDALIIETQAKRIAELEHNRSTLEHNIQKAEGVPRVHGADAVANWRNYY
jgi:hypothetical protein